ncbi:MAG: hypothetical protein WA374_06660 [Acidobacteriaceae bacterium]
MPQLQRGIPAEKLIPLPKQEMAAAERPKIGSMVVHSPLSGCSLSTAVHVKNDGSNDLSFVAGPALRTPQYQVPGMKRKQQMVPVNEVERSERKLRKEVETRRVGKAQRFERNLQAQLDGSRRLLAMHCGG